MQDRKNDPTHCYKTQNSLIVEYYDKTTYVHLGVITSGQEPVKLTHIYTLNNVT